MHISPPKESAFAIRYCGNGVIVVLFRIAGKERGNKHKAMANKAYHEFNTMKNVLIVHNRTSPCLGPRLMNKDD